MRFDWPRPPRIYGILDTGYVASADWISKAQALLEGGADIIQLRAKEVDSAARRALLEEILPLFERTEVPLVVNDDWELARCYPGVGVHLGQDDASVNLVRREMDPDRIIGLSTHSPAQAKGAIALADALDYFAVGPVFATPTKPDYEPVGLELVELVAALNPPIPWFCIGGVKRTNASQVINAGAQALVAVSDFLCPEDTAHAMRQLRSYFDD